MEEIDYMIITPSKIYRLEEKNIKMYEITQEKIKSILQEEGNLEKTLNKSLIILE